MTVTMIPFPMDSSLTAAALGYFEQNRTVVVTVIAPVIFLLRIFVNHLLFRSAASYGELLRDLVLMFLLLSLFPDFVEFLSEIPQLAHQYLSDGRSIEIQTEIIDPKEMSIWKILFWTFTIVKGFSLFVYWLSFAIYQGLLFILVSMAAWAILGGTLLNIAFLLPAFTFCLLLTSLWPVIWYAINAASIEIIELVSSTGVLGESIVQLAGDVMKVSVPIFLLRRSWHSEVISSVRARVRDTRSGLISAAQAPRKVQSLAARTFAGSASRLASLSDTIGLPNEAKWIRQKQSQTSQRFAAIQKKTKNRAGNALKLLGPATKSAARLAIGRPLSSQTTESKARSGEETLLPSNANAGRTSSQTSQTSRTSRASKRSRSEPRSSEENASRIGRKTASPVAQGLKAKPSPSLNRDHPPQGRNHSLHAFSDGLKIQAPLSSQTRLIEYSSRNSHRHPEVRR